MTPTHHAQQMEGEMDLSKHFETIEDLLQTVDSHDLTNWTEDDNGNQVGLEEGYVDATDACNALEAIKAESARLTARIKVLEEALKPFAEAADIKLCGEWRDHESVGRTDIGWHIKFGHLRRARTALGSK